MSKKMLIDATHDQETRVAIVDNGTLVEFDTETAGRKNLKGNVYLARVVRVEPSLQAAFVEYGGDRQGFLAFGDIHPDYYQIPVEDREKLMAEVAEQTAAENAEKEENDEAANAEGENEIETNSPSHSDDTHAELETKRRLLTKRYRIQEVIKPRQVLLVQVIREARGMKGAAVTTYISLPGRYCVLMPNAGVGAGGVSRKITDATTRRKLKSIMEGLTIPVGSGLIMRTAGLGRTKTEIKRDYEYLTRMWSTIRELTLKSTAPSLVYEEGNLIKRAIRDLYTRDVEDILVEGEESCKEAKNFMRLIMPSHSKKIQTYKDEKVPLFHAHGVEDQLQATYNPTVGLKSGGSIVITPTEALVSIDVNSGKSTRERGIEDTAYKTNLEAADEIARQLKLRDHGGLIVIDFIDMYDNRHKSAVEKRLRDAVKDDRARIQIGRISAFGLLEMSRQRLRPSINETGSERCLHCNGLGVIRSAEASSLKVLRQLESEGIKGDIDVLRIKLPVEIALHMLNTKRTQLSNLEQKYGFTLQIIAEYSLKPHEITIERGSVQQAVPASSSERHQSAPRNENREEEREGNNKNKRNRNRKNKNRDRVQPQETSEAMPSSEPVNQEEAPVSQEEKAPQEKRQRRQRPQRAEKPAAPLEAPTSSEETPSEAKEASGDQEPKRQRRDNRFNRKDRGERGGREGRPNRERSERAPREPAPKIDKDLKPIAKRATEAAPMVSSAEVSATVIQENAPKPKKGWWSK